MRFQGSPYTFATVVGATESGVTGYAPVHPIVGPERGPIVGAPLVLTPRWMYGPSFSHLMRLANPLSVSLAGIEPATYRLGGDCSVH